MSVVCVCVSLFSPCYTSLWGWLQSSRQPVAVFSSWSTGANAIRTQQSGLCDVGPTVSFLLF